MKKIALLLLITLTLSCGKNKEEQMLYDYQSKGLKKTFNVDLKDIDFKIINIEKIGTIKSVDSIKYYKQRLALIFYPSSFEYLTDKDLDTINYDYAIDYYDNLQKGYQEIILQNIKNGEEYINYEYKEKRDENLDKMFDVKLWKEKNNLYSKKPDSILSYKYKASYSQINPLLKIKQTFEKFYFTNSSNTKFVYEETVE